MTATLTRTHTTEPFDRALMTVSDYLSDATYLRETGYATQAEQVFTRAETYALHTGFVELIFLVWAHDVRLL